MPFSAEPSRAPPDAPTASRVAANQAILRRVNDAMRRPGRDDAIAFRCECGRLGCNALIRLSRAEYAALRADPRRFAVIPGHEVPEIEDVVEHRGQYAVVATREAPPLES
jgi:hypothetical protein